MNENKWDETKIGVRTSYFFECLGFYASAEEARNAISVVFPAEGGAGAIVQLPNGSTTTVKCYVKKAPKGELGFVAFDDSCSTIVFDPSFAKQNTLVMIGAFCSLLSSAVTKSAHHGIRWFLTAKHIAAEIAWVYKKDRAEISVSKIPFTNRQIAKAIKEGK